VLRAAPVDVLAASPDGQQAGVWIVMLQTILQLSQPEKGQPLQDPDSAAILL